MEEHQVYAMIDERLEMATPSRPATLVRIDPFDAFDHDGDAVRVVGLAHDGDDVQFVIIKSPDGDEMFPSIEASVFKTGVAA